ncbi:MAG: hypothetical protein R3256_11245 [Thalassovita sp.]|nr:hypothetical protein [Thalassovita sp.]
MYVAYNEELERKRIAKSVQRSLLNGIVFATALAVIGIIGWVALGASLGEASISLPEPPKLVR